MLKRLGQHHQHKISSAIASFSSCSSINNNNNKTFSILTQQIRYKGVAVTRTVKIKDLSYEKLKELVDKYGPPPPKGAKGWGLEGHELKINILKEGKNPVIQPAESYPPWILDVLKPDPTLEELKAKKASGATLTLPELKRLKKLSNRQKIKDNNYNRVIGAVLA
ncbi:hypothetical protein ABK040_002275 [Willaertia magna]